MKGVTIVGPSAGNSSSSCSLLLQVGLRDSLLKSVVKWQGYRGGEGKEQKRKKNKVEKKKGEGGSYGEWGGLRKIKEQGLVVARFSLLKAVSVLADFVVWFMGQTNIGGTTKGTTHYGICPFYPLKLLSSIPAHSYQ